MFGIINFETFLLTGILLNLTLGTDTMYILSRSVSNGKKAGIYSALGIGTGSVFHTLIAAAGLSILLTKFELVFIVVKYSGVVYLIYLGLKSIFYSNHVSPDSNHISSGNNFTKIYVSGILTNILNPKVALFYLAFLPQFIASNNTQPFIAFMILGLTFTFTGTIWCLIIATSSATLSSGLRYNKKIRRLLEKSSGLVFILLGIKIALSER